MAAWDETKPAGSRNPKLGDDDIREFKQCMRERLAIDHEFAASESPAFGEAASLIGTHKKVVLNEVASTPTTLANQAAVYAVEVGGTTEVVIRGESNADLLVLTKGGCQKLNALVGFSNGTYSFAFPTSNIGADTKIMMGDANTIAWFYTNSAPPGWAIYASDDYVLRTGPTGGITGGSWTITGLSASSTSGMAQGWDVPVPGRAGTAGDSAPVDHNHVISTSVAHDGGWRPAGRIGKLFQLDLVI